MLLITKYYHEHLMRMFQLTFNLNVPVLDILFICNPVAVITCLSNPLSFPEFIFYIISKLCAGCLNTKNTTNHQLDDDINVALLFKIEFELTYNTPFIVVLLDKVDKTKNIQ